MTDLTRIALYSDPRSDLPPLEAVSHPVAMGPDNTLRATTEPRGWPIVELLPA